MTFFATVVAGLVAGGFGAVGTDVSHLAAVEAATVLRPGLIDHLASFTFETRIAAITSNVPRLPAIVACLFTATTTAAATKVTATASAAAVSSLGFFRHLVRQS